MSVPAAQLWLHSAVFQQYLDQIQDLNNAWPRPPAIIVNENYIHNIKYGSRKKIRSCRFLRIFTYTDDGYF